MIILNSILFLGGVGLVFGLILGLAAKKFAVKVDPSEEQLLNALPGVNCGACGYPGCSGYAAALAKGEAALGKCPVANAEQNVEIAKILGQSVEKTERKVAVILCGGGENCENKMVYNGPQDCKSAASLFGGQKSCNYGCLAFGDCIKACPFDAITQENKNSVPKIDPLKCTGCGLCIKACPKNLIKLTPCKFHQHILCLSNDKGAIVRKICTTGCIGCGLCVRECPVNDIVLENNLAIMKYENCTNCGICVSKCPTKTIKSFLKIPSSKSF